MSLDNSNELEEIVYIDANNDLRNVDNINAPFIDFDLDDITDSDDIKDSNDIRDREDITDAEKIDEPFIDFDLDDMYDKEEHVDNIIEKTGGSRIEENNEGNAPGENIAQKTLSDAEVNKIVDETFNNQSECHFNKSSPGEKVCSPDQIVNKMEEFIDQKIQKKSERNTSAEGSGDKHQANKPVKDKSHKTKVVSTMKDYFDCNSESCILKREDFRNFAKLNNIDSILDEYFKPKGPATNFGLLSNKHIDTILDQLAKKFPERKFLHVPFQMRDFERQKTELAKIDLAEELKKDKKTFGVVFNTDYSHGNGIHWFCVFGENYPNGVQLEYFNSSGRPPLQEIQTWIHKTKHKLQQDLNKPVNVIYSTGKEFQKNDTCCGVYAIAYIWLRLEDVPANWFKPEKFNDDMMAKLRRNLFRWEV